MAWSFRRIRQTGLLLCLLVVSIWGYLNYRADRFTFAWDEPVEVLVVAMIDPATDMNNGRNREFLQRFLSVDRRGGNIHAIEEWFDAEYERLTGTANKTLTFVVGDAVQVKRPPPLLPDADDSFYDRWQQTDAFVDYFQDVNREHDLLRDAYDATIFVYFYDRSRTSTFEEHHPVATKRQRFGIVFVPLEPISQGFYAALFAHELCHTFGATDKYDGARSVYPHGYAEPKKSPRYPQRHAEIMALGIPVAEGVERRVQRISDCRVGDLTAQEMNWR